MKYSEFNNKLVDMELQYTESDIFIYCDGILIGKVSRQYRYMMSTHYDGLDQFPDGYVSKMLMAMTMLAETPLAEREEEKRYYLLSVSPMLRKSECGHLLYHKSMGRYFTGSAEYGGDVYQAIFTESEISQMDITGFEKIEVEETK